VRGKIVGGSAVPSIKAYPFMVSLQWAGTGTHFCGGAVVSGQFVLTAAHCVVGKDPGLLRVVQGRLTLTAGDGLAIG
jgi:secreted trypsin-like serine protease